MTANPRLDLDDNDSHAEGLASEAASTSGEVFARLRAASLDGEYWRLHNETATALLSSHAPHSTRILYTDDILGNALFATAVVQAGEVIGEYTGVLRRSPGARDPALPYAVSLFPSGAKLLPSERMVLDAACADHPLRYMNHLGSHVQIVYPDQRRECGPNTCFLPVFVASCYRVAVVALRDIAVGDELRADYGDGYFTAQGAPRPITRLYHAGITGVRRIVA